MSDLTAKLGAGLWNAVLMEHGKRTFETDPDRHAEHRTTSRLAATHAH